MHKHIHIIGISGVGMSCLADLICCKKYFCSYLTGSDYVWSDYSVSLVNRHNISIFVPPIPSVISSDTLVIYTSGIQDNYPDYMYARENNITLSSRLDFLYYLLDSIPCISVTGTHGKTTTTSLIGHVMSSCDVPSIICSGGSLIGHETSLIYHSQPKCAVVELDESDGIFQNISSHYNIITSISYDHIENYDSQTHYEMSYINFVMHNKNNVFIVYDECDFLKDVFSENCINVIWYGLRETSDVFANNITMKDGMMYFNVTMSDIFSDHKPIECSVPLWGYHNACNVLPSLIMGYIFLLDIKKITSSLVSFPCITRRMEKKYINNNIIINDYAHHPNEIRCTLHSISQSTSLPIICCFEPHKVCRLEYFFDDFIDVLSMVDKLYLFPVFLANKDDSLARSSFLVNKMKKHLIDRSTDVYVIANMSSFSPEIFVSYIYSPHRHVLLFLGAGLIYKSYQETLNYFHCME